MFYLSACEQRARFRAGSPSPVEMMIATIARCEAMQPAINAFARWFPDRALDEARRSIDAVT